MDEFPIEATVYSMTEEPPPAPSRRGDERHLTLFRVGSFIVDSRRELCLVKNISAGGALVRCFSALRIGQPVEIELREGEPATGRVSWISGPNAGIQFDKRVDVFALLSSGADDLRPRMPRVEAKSVVFVREGAVVHRGLIQNVSQGGVSVEVPNALTLGAKVTVRLLGLEPRDGVVRWRNQHRYGISFNSVLGLSALVEWLQTRRG